MTTTSNFKGLAGFGLCGCGCGERTRIFKQNDPRHGYRKGMPARFVTGHNMRRNFADAYVVDATTGCWVWQRATDGRYGELRERGKRTKAHRFFYEREHGPIPEGMVIDHLCRNTLCVNPDHMEVVTQVENMRRSKTVGLSMEVADRIREASGSHVEVGRRFGVSANTVYAIRTGRIWARKGPDVGRQG